MPPNPACRSLTRQGFKSVFQTALRSLGNRSIVVVGNYEFGPITAEPCRAKARPLRPRRSYFAPVWWRRRVLPPGPMGLLRRPFITIAGLRRHHEYSRPRLTKKERLQAPVPAARARSGDWRCGVSRYDLSPRPLRQKIVAIASRPPIDCAIREVNALSRGRRLARMRGREGSSSWPRT